MTVSNAYNRPDVVAPETMERILAEAVKLGYPGPSAAGRSLRLGRSDTVGVLLSQRLPHAFNDPGIASILSGVSSVLTEQGQALLLIPTDGGSGLGVVRNAIVDAMVLCNLSPDAEAVDVARGRHLPLVTVGSPNIAGVPFFGVDNAKAAAGAARHLLGLGHRSFGVLSIAPQSAENSEPWFYVVDRVNGFLKALRRGGVDPASVRVVESRTNTRKDGGQAATALLDGPPARRPSAIFAVTDILALGSLDAAATLDIEVPRRLSIVGFDDIDEAARSTPPLTTVSFGLYEQGRAAAAAALAGAQGRPADVPRIATHLRVRGTTGSKPAQRRRT